MESNAVGRNAAHADSQPELSDYPVALVDSNVTVILRLPRTYTTGDAARMAALRDPQAVLGDGFGVPDSEVPPAGAAYPLEHAESKAKLARASAGSSGSSTAVAPPTA